MDIRTPLLCGLLCALVFTNLGCNHNASTAASNAPRVQHVTLSAQCSETGQEPLAIYNDDLSLLSRRIQSSVSDRWYLTSHKDGLDKQITHDLDTVLADMDDMSQMESAPAAPGVHLKDVIGKLRPDADRVAVSVRAYMDATTPAAHDKALVAVQQDLKDSLKRLAAIRKVKQPHGPTTAKI